MRLNRSWNRDTAGPEAGLGVLVVVAFYGDILSCVKERNGIEARDP
jgi:hypothetical protein